MHPSIAVPAPGYPGHYGEVGINSLSKNRVTDVFPTKYPPNTRQCGAIFDDEFPTKSRALYPGEIVRVPADLPTKSPPYVSVSTVLDSDSSSSF